MIWLVDDSIGGVEASKILNLKGISTKVVIDNLNYPTSLRKNFKFDYLDSVREDIISTNPYIEHKLNKISKKIFKLENEDLSDSIILTNKGFSEILSKKYKVKDMTTLSNLVHHGNFNEYIIYNLIENYIENYKKIYVLESNALLLKKYFYKYDRNFIFVDYFLNKYLDHEKNISDLKTQIYVTGYRRGFYLTLEDIYKEDFSYVRSL